MDEIGEVGQLPSVETLAEVDGFELRAYKPGNLGLKPLGIEVAVAAPSTLPVVRVEQRTPAPPEKLFGNRLSGRAGDDFS